MAVPRPSVNYSASDTKCLQYIGCFYSPIRRRNNAVLLWRALKERKERAGLEFPALQQKKATPRKPSPQVAGTRGTRSCFVLPSQSSGDGKKPELATGGPDSKDDF